MTDIHPQALRARELYAAGATTARIRAETGLKSWEIYFWLDGGPGAPGPRALPAIPRRRRSPPRPVAKNERAALIARMMRAADLQVSDIEQRLANAGLEGGAPLDREREARVLAVLARTLRELIALDARQDHDKRHNAEDDDPPPRDLDELRRELARRIDRLRAGSGAATPGGDAGT